MGKQNHIARRLEILESQGTVIPSADGKTAPRPEIAAKPASPDLLPRRAFICACVGGLAECLTFKSHFEGPSNLLVREAPPAQRGATPTQKVDSRVELEASNSRLVEGFRWAKQQALSYVFTGDPVGPWYEAALPGREAFCMRDTAHQSTGAQILGLAAFNENMLRKFAANIAASRDWCSYWEINKNNVPAPVDYVNDRDFWYNLPANFDVLDACYRQFLWTGNRAYLDSAFLNFYARTVTEYVKKWDVNGDGLLEHLSQYGHRGIASYDEQHIEQMMVGADLVAAQYAAYRDYAKIQFLLNNKPMPEEFSRKAAQLKALYNKNWWNSAQDRYYGALGNDGQFHGDLASGSAIENVLFSLYCGITEGGHKTERALATLLQQLPPDNNHIGGVEERSYVPEILYRYGRSDEGCRALLSLMDPTLKRREYPEVSFAAIGACATGAMGITAEFPLNLVGTFPRLPGSEWVTLKHLPVFENEISVRHMGTRSTVFTNESGPPIQWRASLPSASGRLTLDGRQMTAKKGQRLGGIAETWITVEVPSGQQRTVEVTS
jgi:hypothetical protein